MKLELVVGPQQNGDSGVVALRGGKLGDLIVSQLHGEYYEQAVRGNLFSGANQAAQAVSAALATTYTGLCLYNPVGSGKNLVPLKAKYALSLAPAAVATLGLIGGFAATGGVTALTSEVVPTQNIIGGPRGVGKLLNQATIVTPTWLAHHVDGFTAAAFPGPAPVWDLEGLFIVPPGGFIAIGALTAVTGLGMWVWEEVPI